MNTSTSKEEMHASLTSFSQLFERNIQGQTIEQIEIPPIQRDYAQGRKSDNVDRIRQNFIQALCRALLPSEPAIDLDFIFGDVEDKKGERRGTFCPLDGQQRLTTLFLLHCYLAWRTNIRPVDQPWRRFTYSTRPGTRDFCHFLTRCKPDFSGVLSTWIKDHADYLPTWQHDPSIQSMLVVLDAFDEWFSTERPDFEAAWAKLVGEPTSAICFHVLPMKANGLTDAIYIKMNSRGKPLTAFENFKAHFEDMLKEAHPDREKEFAHKVDTDWSDILWPYRGNDNLIDDEFLRYFRCITEICAWRSDISFGDGVRDDDLAEQVYGASAASTGENLEFLFQAWDVWKGEEVKARFEAILTRDAGGASTPLLLFNSFDQEGVNLFHACCARYGSRSWTLAHTLLLYGVLIRFIREVDSNDASTRLRILRNLVEASEDEIRAGERNNMPKLLIEVEQIIVNGSLQRVSTFNQVQVKNERDKAEVLQSMPALAADLHRLEDHDLLRGGLTAFDLDPKTFAPRARAFISIFDKPSYPCHLPWLRVTGALLAKGDYSRHVPRWTGHRWTSFGAPKNDEPWQVLFRRRKGELEHPVTTHLRALLDDVATGNTLQSVISAYLNSADTPKDWRYYFVKYDSMREGASGRYTISRSGYQVCMLDKERMSSVYYDAYLLAAAHLGGVSPDDIANVKWPRCFTSDENIPRSLVLKSSGLQIQCIDQGWQINGIPNDVVQRANFEGVCASFGIGENLVCPVPQKNGIDTADRVELGAKLFTALLTMDAASSS